MLKVLSDFSLQMCLIESTSGIGDSYTNIHKDDVLQILYSCTLHQSVLICMPPVRIVMCIYNISGQCMNLQGKKFVTFIFASFLNRDKLS